MDYISGLAREAGRPLRGRGLWTLAFWARLVEGQSKNTMKIQFMPLPVALSPFGSFTSDQGSSWLALPSVAEDAFAWLPEATNAPDLVKYLTIPLILFLLGISGVFLNRKNILIILMSVELMLLAINFNFIIFSVYLDDVVGEIFALFILTVAAAESAIGLAILVVYYRIRGTIAIELVSLLRR